MNDDCVCIIRYMENGKLWAWSIGADATKDNEQTIREHLKRHKPKAEFISCEFRPIGKQEAP